MPYFVMRRNLTNNRLFPLVDEDKVMEFDTADEADRYAIDKIQSGDWRVYEAP